MSPRRYKITVDGTSHDVEVGDVAASPVRVNVDGVDYDVEVPGKPARRATPAQPSALARPIARPTAAAFLDSHLARAFAPSDTTPLRDAIPSVEASPGLTDFARTVVEGPLFCTNVDESIEFLQELDISVLGI